MKHYRQYGRKSVSKTMKEKLMLVNEDNLIYDCWRFEESYPTLGGEWIHKTMIKTEENEVVRHACGESKCVNPMHLLRGSDIDNAKDEISVMKYGVLLLEQELDDHSLDGVDIDNQVKYLTLIARARVKLRDKYNFYTLKDVSSFVREMYRREKVSIWTTQKIFDDMKDYAMERYNRLSRHSEVTIVKLPLGIYERRVYGKR